MLVKPKIPTSSLILPILYRVPFMIFKEKDKNNYIFHICPKHPFFKMKKWLYLAKNYLLTSTFSYFFRNCINWNLNKSCNFSKFLKMFPKNLKFSLKFCFLAIRKWSNGLMNGTFSRIKSFRSFSYFGKFSKKRHFQKFNKFKFLKNLTLTPLMIGFYASFKLKFLRKYQNITYFIPFLPLKIQTFVVNWYKSKHWLLIFDIKSLSKAFWNLQFLRMLQVFFLSLRS